MEGCRYGGLNNSGTVSRHTIGLYKDGSKVMSRVTQVLSLDLFWKRLRESIRAAFFVDVRKAGG